jgi:hypothetical protein
MGDYKETIPQGLKPALVAARDAKAKALAYLEAKTVGSISNGGLHSRGLYLKPWVLFEDAGYYVVVVGFGDEGAVEGAGD